MFAQRNIGASAIARTGVPSYSQCETSASAPPLMQPGLRLAALLHNDSNETKKCPYYLLIDNIRSRHSVSQLITTALADASFA